jgi:c-di-GMP-binding flagellar brake protein YcgR
MTGDVARPRLGGRLVPRYVASDVCQIRVPRPQRAFRRASEWIIEGRLVDLSVGGAAIALDDRSDIERFVDRPVVTLVVGTATLRAKVRHFEPGLDPAQIGVEFLDVDEAAERFLYQQVGRARDADGHLRDQWEGST